MDVVEEVECLNLFYRYSVDFQEFQWYLFILAVLTCQSSSCESNTGKDCYKCGGALVGKKIDERNMIAVNIVVIMHRAMFIGRYITK